MKQLKNYLVVLPLVLMFMLQALPVAVEAEESKQTRTEKWTDQVINLNLPDTITATATCSFSDDRRDILIANNYETKSKDQKLVADIEVTYNVVMGTDGKEDKEKTTQKRDEAYGKIYNDLKAKAVLAYKKSICEDMEKNYIPSYLSEQIKGQYKVQSCDLSKNSNTGENTDVKLDVELKVSRNKNTFRIRAIDIRNKNVIVEQDMEMKDVASSLNDAEVAFRELYERNKLKGMTYVKAERNKDLTASDLYYDSKVTPLTVLHILKGRAPLGEVVPLGVLPRNAEEATILVKEHKVIQGRIRQLATRGYQFDKIVYDDGYRRNPLVREYYDMEGNKAIIEDSLPVLYIYYVPGTPAAANKKVEAAKAEDIQPSVNPPVTAELQAPAPAVLGAVTANNPDPNENPNEAHLPATGEQDHIVLLLSSIGLMIVGLVLSKKR